MPRTGFDALMFDRYGTLIDWRRELGEIDFRLTSRADLVTRY